MLSVAGHACGIRQGLWRSRADQFHAMSVPLIRAGAVCSTALCWLPAASVFQLTKAFIEATENPRRAGCGWQFSVFPTGVLLAAGDVLSLVDAGVERIAAR